MNSDVLFVGTLLIKTLTISVLLVGFGSSPARALDCPAFLKGFVSIFKKEVPEEKITQPFIYRDHTIMTAERLKAFNARFEGLPYAKGIDELDNQHFYVYFRQLPTDLQEFLKDELGRSPSESIAFLEALNKAAKFGDDSFIFNIINFIKKEPDYQEQRHSVVFILKHGLDDLRHTTPAEYIALRTKVFEAMEAARIHLE